MESVFFAWEKSAYKTMNKVPHARHSNTSNHWGRTTQCTTGHKTPCSTPASRKSLPVAIFHLPKSTQQLKNTRAPLTGLEEATDRFRLFWKCVTFRPFTAIRRKLLSKP